MTKVTIILTTEEERALEASIKAFISEPASKIPVSWAVVCTLYFIATVIVGFMMAEGHTWPALVLAFCLGCIGIEGIYKLSAALTRAERSVGIIRVLGPLLEKSMEEEA